MLLKVTDTNTDTVILTSMENIIESSIKTGNCPYVIEDDDFLHCINKANIFRFLQSTKKTGGKNHENNYTQL